MTFPARLRPARPRPTLTCRSPPGRAKPAPGRGANTVVVRMGQNVLQVVDNVPANVDSTPAAGAAYRRAAQALAAKILSHM